MENKGKKAYITGGSRGIGKGIVQVLSSSGYDIVFTYNSEKSEAIALKKETEAKGVKCEFMQASLEKADVAVPTAKRAIEILGGIDLFVSNAGLTRHNSLLSVDTEMMDFLYTLNYKSYILGSKVAANHMVDNKIKGSIVFITSTRGIRAYPEDCLYGSFKAGLMRGVESMALEMAQYGIRINCIAPGATEIREEPSLEVVTDGSFVSKIPLRRKGAPKEVGALVEYLASDKAAYMTGNTIKLDGGLILSGMPEV
jgi:Dehydrogenases with different specificities (related to short-chain alcohol dehydrogenases)